MLFFLFYHKSKKSSQQVFSESDKRIKINYEKKKTLPNETFFLPLHPHGIGARATSGMWQLRKLTCARTIFPGRGINLRRGGLSIIPLLLSRGDLSKVGIMEPKFCCLPRWAAPLLTRWNIFRHFKSDRRRITKWYRFRVRRLRSGAHK